uniref:Gag-pol polyprotein, putative n=1 Tax=Solanum tuberosum TaxID=4113 RepID=Q60CW8_SOLTU|nr:Gag-pol polyprotein, putative [Solanum tuberosum]
MMSLFVIGLPRLSDKESKAAMLIGGMDIARLMIHVQQVDKRAKTSRNESGQRKSNVSWSSFQHKQKGPAPSSTSAPVPKNKGEYNGQNSQNFRARPAHSQGSKAQGGTKTPACARCGCFKCGQEGHFMQECPKNKQGNGNGVNRAHLSSVAPPDKALPRGAISSAGGGTNRLYDIKSRQEQENSRDVVAGMIQFFDITVYALLDPEANLSFVTLDVAMNFDVIPEQLSEPISVSTPIGESILAERVYRDCLVSVNHKSTMDDLIELDMGRF